MKELILCGNGNLLQYVVQEVSHDGVRAIHSVIDDISTIISHDALKKCDILLAVSWREVENWIKSLKNMGAERIYRIPVFAMQYKLPIIKNGLLILKQPDELWETMRECHVSMDISPYPPTMKMIKDLLKKLDAENIPYGTIAEELHDFRKSLTLYPTHNPEEAIRLCKSSHCHFLRNGKIAKCPLPLLIDDFNHAYSCRIQSEDIFDIYGEKSGPELKQRLAQPADMCRYCPDKVTFITWQQTQQDACMEDWVMEEKN